MSKPVSISNTFATQTGNIPLAQLDQNFTGLQTAINDPATYQNYGADSGTVNAMVVTLNPAPASLASMIGVPIQVKVNVTNTGAVTLNLNSFGAINVVDLLNTTLTAGLLVAGQTVQMIYNGSVFQWQGQVPVAVSASGRLLNIQYFTTAGTATYTPTTGTNSVIVEVVGGGGGGAGGGSSGASGGNGGTSSFGALVSATGGGGGSSIGFVSNGGSGSSGDLNVTGGNATGGAGAGAGYSRKKITSAFSGVTVTVGAGGTGGAGGGSTSSKIGNKATSPIFCPSSWDGNSQNGAGYGGGANGNGTTSTGGVGAQGIVIIYEYA